MANGNQRAQQNTALLDYPPLLEAMHRWDQQKKLEMAAAVGGEDFARRSLPRPPTPIDRNALRLDAIEVLNELAKTESQLAKNVQPSNPAALLNAILDYYGTVANAEASSIGSVNSARVRQWGDLTRDASKRLTEIEEQRNAEVDAAAQGEIAEMAGLLAASGEAPESEFSTMFLDTIARAPEDQQMARLSYLRRLTGYDEASLTELARRGSAGLSEDQLDVAMGRLPERAANLQAREMGARRDLQEAGQHLDQIFGGTGRMARLGNNFLEQLTGALFGGDDVDGDTIARLLGMTGLEEVPESASGAQARSIIEDMLDFPDVDAWHTSLGWEQEVMHGSGAEHDMFVEFARQRGYDAENDPRGTFNRLAAEYRASTAQESRSSDLNWAYNVLHGNIPARARDFLKANWIRAREMFQGWPGVPGDDDWARLVAEKEGRPLEEVQADHRARREQHNARQATLQEQGREEAQRQPGETIQQQQQAGELQPEGAVPAPPAAGEPAAPPAPPAEAAVPEAPFDPASIPNMAELQQAARELRDEGAFGTMLASGEQLTDDAIVDYVQEHYPDTPREAITWAMANPDAALGRTGSDGWADYTLHQDGRITFTHPTSGQEVTVTERQSGPYWAIRAKAFGDEVPEAHRQSVEAAHQRNVVAPQQAQERQVREGISGPRGEEKTWVPTKADGSEGFYEVRRPDGAVMYLGSDEETIISNPEAIRALNRKKSGTAGGAELNIPELRLPRRVETAEAPAPAEVPAEPQANLSPGFFESLPAAPQAAPAQAAPQVEPAATPAPEPAPEPTKTPRPVVGPRPATESGRSAQAETPSGGGGFASFIESAASQAEGEPAEDGEAVASAGAPLQEPAPAEEPVEREQEEEEAPQQAVAAAPPPSVGPRQEQMPAATPSAAPKTAPGVTSFEAQAHNITPASPSAMAASVPSLSMASGATGRASSPRAQYGRAKMDALTESLRQRMEQQQPVVG